MEHFVVSTITFRASGYDAEDRTALAETFKPFGPTRLRPQTATEAGGSGEIWLVLEFIGITIATGVLAEIGIDLYRRISTSLKEFADRKNQRTPAQVEVADIILSFDDMDIVIHNPSDKIIESLDVIVERARRGVSSGVLKDMNVTKIDIPGVPGFDGWEEFRGPIEDRAEDLKHWAITTDGEYAPSHGYDSEDDKLLDDLLTQEPWEDPDSWEK
jgi:hypothetical protein